MYKARIVLASSILSLVVFTSVHYLTTLMFAAPSANKVEALMEKSVFQVHNGFGVSGTGFVVRLGSKTISISNAHVCESSLDGNMYVRDKAIKIIAIYTKHDLCALEAPTWGKPLKLAEDVYQDENIYAVGYPAIPFLTAALGEVKGYDMMRFDLSTIPEEKCLGRFTFSENCFFAAKSVATTVTCDFGCSGSPLLNEDLEVIGVVFAVRGGASRAAGVPLQFLQDFLKELGK